MNRRGFIRAVGLGAAGLSLWPAMSARADGPADKPNVIIILADDLGNSDTEILTKGWIKTPHLKQMSADGLTFTDFHSNSSVCSPTRAALLTGRYQQRSGIVDVMARHLDTPSLPPTELTLPRLMKGGGYRTALFGKWHLGKEPENNPVHHGFDEFRGFLDGYIDYHKHEKTWHNGLKVEDQKGYSTHLITNNSVEFIKRNKDKPFFMYVAHESVHLPYHTPADTAAGRKPIPKGKRWDRDRIRPKYKIMVEELDKGIGEILSTLKECKIERKTFVFFFSDNGAVGFGSNAPYRGGKFSHYEGGHRGGAIAWMPSRIKSGTTNALTAGMDLLPTITDLVGIKVPPTRKLDGRSMKDLIFKGADFPDRKIFFGYEPKLGTALRDGPWKMIVKKGKAQLYDLRTDIGERNNIIDKHPKRAREMQSAIKKWADEMQVQVDARRRKK
ncbi:MAG: sulfatase-like hydrolase/transferase [bacterium]|nr:sulfatase-like hydrolase/transferase [bacterium]